MPHHSFAQIPPARASLWIRTIGLAVSALLLLGGCQGSGTPSDTSTTTASPTLSATASRAPTPTPTAAYKPADAKGKAQNVPVPVMPALAKENTKEGLEAFIRYWYATYSYALETGDLQAWSACTDLTTPVAQAHKESVELNYIDGRWMAGGRLTTPIVEVSWIDGASKPASAKVQVIQEKIQYFDANGSKGQKDSAATNTADAVFSSYEDGSWHVTNYGAIVG